MSLWRDLESEVVLGHRRRVVQVACDLSKLGHLLPPFHYSHFIDKETPETICKFA